MAWPPAIPPATRDNSTSSIDNHPSDHNLTSAALTELVARVNARTWITGEIREFAAATCVPANWLVCDGAAVSRTTYAALYSKLGTLWGAGNGSTTFNVPNLINEFTRGATEGAATGGTNDLVTISHTHTAESTNTDHAHGVNGTATTGGAHNHGSPPWEGKQFLYNDDVPSGFGLTGVGNIRSATWSSAPDHTHPLSAGTALVNTGNYPAGANHGHTINDAAPGVTGTNRNIPHYRTVVKAIFTGL